MKRLISLLVCILCVICVMPVSATPPARDYTLEQTLAVSLKNLGLFKGVSDSDLNLDGTSTRVEAVVMLIRLTGKENEVLSGDFSHPFTDVPVWADKYIGYAFQNGITKGISGTEFGNGRATAATYLTFVMRALGYSDADGDFAWDNPLPRATEAGIVPPQTDVDNFLRADVVLISCAALCSNMQHSNLRLADALISEGVFTADDFAGALDRDIINTPSVFSPGIKFSVKRLTGVRTFSFTISNQVDFTYFAVYDGNNSWVEFDIKNKALTTDFSLSTDIDFDSMDSVQIRYVRKEFDGGTHMKQFSTASLINGGRYSICEDDVPTLTLK